jgi:hypothetical protein
MSGEWRKISCVEREDLIDEKGRSFNGFHDESGIGVLSSLTDPDGTYGSPRVFTEWGYDYDQPVLRDERYPGTDRPCEHHAWEPAS